MKLSRVLLTVVAVLALAAAVPATAQESGATPVFDAPVAATVVPDAADNSPEPVPNWGIDAWIGYWVNPCDAIDRQASGIGINTTNCTELAPASDGTAYPGFPVHLPQGASAQFIRIYYYGNNASQSISAGFWKVSPNGNNTLIQDLSPPGTAGGATYEQFGPFSETIDNSPASGYTYNILAAVYKSGASVTKIYKFYIYYKLQISPDPAYATFSDVPVGAFGHRHVEALVASGITTGCGGGNFCPNQPLTRVQMAVFLAKALGLHWQY